MRFTEYLVEEPEQQQLNLPKPRVRPADGKYPNQPQQQQPQQAQQQQPSKIWDTIKNAAVIDSNSGREFITLLGAMYQAKRRNPAVQMEMPALVKSLPAQTPEQRILKKQMEQLFALAKDEDMPHLAARSQELQKARMSAAAKPGTNPTPGQQPAGQVSNKNVGGQGQTMLDQLLALIKKAAPQLNPKQAKKAKRELNAALKANSPNVPNVPTPQGKPAAVSMGGA